MQDTCGYSGEPHDFYGGSGCYDLASIEFVYLNSVGFRRYKYIHIIQAGDIMNRNIVMKFRATEEEAAEIRRKAAAAGMNVSRFLRTSAVKSQVVLYNTADIYGLRSDIRRIGNNINQIAMVVNSNRAVYQNDVRELRKQLNEMSGSIAEHLKPLSYEVL